MDQSEYLPEKLYIEKDSLDFPLTKRILKNAGHIPAEIIHHTQELTEKMRAAGDSLGEGKKHLFITRQRGEFIKPCPCTPHYVGCGYTIINLDLNCPLDCSYCILQHYLTDPFISVHVNLKDLWRQLDVFLHRNRERNLRIGTGELADSLALDHITGNSKEMISYFREKKNVFLELKTKTVNIKNILDVKPAPNVVIAWSLNSVRIAREEEHGAPSVEERINAAQQVAAMGYRVGFHFDPLIRYSGWEEEYGEVIRRLLTAVDPGRIAWISLGSLRFPPALKEIIKERFPASKVVYDEFFPGKDGKLRYFKPLRLELYKKIMDFIRNWGGRKIRVYFCMESEEIWRETLGWVPRGKEHLSSVLTSPLLSACQQRIS